MIGWDVGNNKPPLPLLTQSYLAQLLDIFYELLLDVANLISVGQTHDSIQHFWHD